MRGRDENVLGKSKFVFTEPHKTVVTQPIRSLLIRAGRSTANSGVSSGTPSAQIYSSDRRCRRSKMREDRRNSKRNTLVSGKNTTITESPPKERASRSNVSRIKNNDCYKIPIKKHDFPLVVTKI